MIVYPDGLPGLEANFYNHTGEIVASFKFGSSKRTFQIDGWAKVYTIDVGNADTMKKWHDGAAGVLEAAERFKLSGASDIIAVVQACRAAVNLVLDGDFDPLWELADHNIYAMLSLVQALTIEINAGQQEAGKALGL